MNEDHVKNAEDLITTVATEVVMEEYISMLIPIYKDIYTLFNGKIKGIKILETEDGLSFETL